MRRGPCERDLRLSAVMAVALVLLAGLYLVALAVPLWLFSIGLLSLRYALLADGVILVLLAAEYFSLDKAALRACGARFVDRTQAPKLHETVERLAALADLPTPRVAVVDAEAPNAFAVGRDPAHSTVIVTRGLVATLEPEEIAAVLAHELAHVANRDGAVLTVASFPGLTLHRLLDQATIKMWIFGLPIMVFASAGYVVGAGVMIAVSRCREYAADRSAALLTGAPEQLMSALQKISGRLSAIPRDDLRSVAPMTAFFVLPTRGNSVTHPSLERRLQRLAAVARELGDPALPPAVPQVARPASARANLLFGLVTFVVAFVALVVIGTALW